MYCKIKRSNWNKLSESTKSLMLMLGRVIIEDDLPGIELTVWESDDNELLVMYFDTVTEAKKAGLHYKDYHAIDIKQFKKGKLYKEWHLDKETNTYEQDL